jgi:hypothetical protein
MRPASGGARGNRLKAGICLPQKFVWRFRERPKSRIGKSGPAQEEIKNFFKIAGSLTAKASVLYRT